MYGMTLTIFHVTRTYKLTPYSVIRLTRVAISLQGWVSTGVLLCVLLQSMISKQMVVHASRDPTVPFFDGYFFYCIHHRKEGQLNTHPSHDRLTYSCAYLVQSEM